MSNRERNFDPDTGEPVREACFACEGDLRGPMIGVVGTPGICQQCLRSRVPLLSADVDGSLLGNPCPSRNGVYDVPCDREAGHADPLHQSAVGDDEYAFWPGDKPRSLENIHESVRAEVQERGETYRRWREEKGLSR